MGGKEGFLALAAGGALAAVLGGAFVAGVGVGKVDPEGGTGGGDFCLGVVDEGAQDLELGVGAEMDGVCHGGHEVFSAIGVEGVVAVVGGNDDGFRAVAFRDTGGDGQEDTVAEGDDGLLEVFLCVVAGGDGICAAEQGAGEMLRDGGDVYLMIGDAEMLCLPACAGELASGVVAAVIEGQGAHNLMVGVRPVQGGGGVQTAGEENGNVHALRQGGFPAGARRCR